MKCPRCEYEQPDGLPECQRCRIIFSKWEARQSHSSTVPIATEPPVKKDFFPSKKKIAVAIITIILIVVSVSVIYYWLWTRSPEYSLLEIKKAIENHDITSFEKYVDMQGITEGIVIEIMESDPGQKRQPVNPWEQMGNVLAKGFLNLFKPHLVELVKKQITYYVEKGAFKAEQKGPETFLKDMWDKVGGQRSKFQKIEYIKKDGKIAVIGLGFYYERYSEKLVLDIKMRDKGGYWQVAEMSNLSDYMKRIEKLESNYKIENPFGLKKYPASQYDEETSGLFGKTFFAQAYCYRTKDSVGGVVEFFKKPVLVEDVDGTKIKAHVVDDGIGQGKARLFFAEQNVDILIQNPWNDFKTNEVIKETLITVYREIYMPGAW